MVGTELLIKVFLEIKTNIKSYTLKMFSFFFFVNGRDEEVKSNFPLTLILKS